MGQRRALLVHNSRFVDPSLHALPAADADIERLKDLLQRDYVGFAAEHITTLSNPSLTDFRMAVLEFFRNAEADDYLFFYYAGHGIRNDTGELYLALRNTKVDSFEAMALEAAFIRRSLESCLSEKKIVVLDCCNAGAFRKSGLMVARDAAYDPGLISANFDPKGTGTYVLGASQSGASAYETIGEDGQPYSLFTNAFIRAVETGDAAPASDVITLIDISRYIHGQRNAKGQATRPYIDVTNSVGFLEFAKNPNLRTDAAVTTPDIIFHEPDPVFARAVANSAAPRARARWWLGLGAVTVLGMGALLMTQFYPRHPSDILATPKVSQPAERGVDIQPQSDTGDVVTPPATKAPDTFANPTPSTAEATPEPPVRAAAAPEPVAPDSPATQEIPAPKVPDPTAPAPEATIPEATIPDAAAQIAPAPQVSIPVTKGETTPPDPTPKAPQLAAVDPVPKASEHQIICATNPQLDLDLSQPALWQMEPDADTRLVSVASLPSGWDDKMQWFGLSPDGLVQTQQVLMTRLEFCSCDPQDAIADISRLRADNGFRIALDGDVEAVNFGQTQEIDMHSARSTPYAVRLKSHLAGTRTLVFEVDNKRANSPLGFAIEGRLKSANSYAGRCRD